ncbi:hypothetical protein VCUG_00203 [Vavraia culicis subsp. floridensis]|uniref:H/ACA ribonucleoprotein complex subunit NOP10 n=1 Tax=Vavraia culicis (isolate floridensis) TaxID=948595 RepID=L2GYG2_VAVCU|nr:uncharacterized protein VCUG_00203 [Vavraia culicis subsp. floridensis]ELA48367.1 hypothetical protein VCUG_00203 [Vavraia culicis subsp. floridensis]
MLKHRILNGKKVYTLDQKETDSHPARFSPIDSFSEERVRLKIKYGMPPFEERDGVEE